MLVTCHVIYIYIFTSYCLIGPVRTWEFPKKMDVFESTPSKWASQIVPNKAWPSHPKPASHVHYQRPRGAEFLPARVPWAQKPSMVWTPRRPPRWLKPPTWTRQMARRPGQFRLTGTEMCRWMSFTVLKMGFNTSFFRFLKLHSCIYHTPFAIKVRIYRSPILNIFFSRGL